MNTRSNVALSAMLAAAGVAAVACAACVENASAFVGDTVITTARQTPEATAAMRRAGNPPIPRDNWISISGAAGPVPAGVLAPGSRVDIGTAEAGGECTLNAGIRSASSARSGFLTAGHCGEDGMEVRVGSATGALVGHVSDSDHSLDTAADVMSDSAVVWTTAAAPTTATVAGLPIAGVMTRDAALMLPKSTPVCFDGATSGVICSPLDGADITTMSIEGAAERGDSGSAVFLVDGTTRTVTLVGIVSLADESGSVVTYLDPALERVGAAVLVDSAAAGSVAGDPRYSARTVPMD